MSFRSLLRRFGGPADDRVDRWSPPNGADVATAAAVVVVATAAITTSGGGAVEAKVAADDVDRVVMGITEGKNAGGRRSFLLVWASV